MFEYFKISDKKLTKIQDETEANWIHISPPLDLEKLKVFATNEDIPYSHFINSMDINEISRFEISKEGVRLFILNTPTENINVDIDDEAEYVTTPVGIIQTDDKLITISASKNALMDWCTSELILKDIDFSFNTIIVRLFKRNVYMFIYYLKEINKQISKVEKDLKNSSSNEGLNKLLMIQKSLIYFLNDLRTDEAVIDKYKEFLIQRDKYSKHRESIQDIMIEYRQAVDMANVYSNILGNIMSAFGSIISNNLNYVINRLTGITIILMVPTLIVGIYGMNVPLPLENQPNAFLIIFIFTVIITFISIYYFKHKKWM